MKRGEVWTVASGGGYAAKPRPVVIIQDDRFQTLDSVTVCPLTTDAADLALFRIAVDPSALNGLHSASRIMVDKITTVPRKRLGRSIGRLADEDLVRLSRALLVFIGVATPKG